MNSAIKFKSGQFQEAIRPAITSHSGQIKFKPESRDGFYRLLQLEAGKIVPGDARFASTSVFVKAVVFLSMMVAASLAIYSGKGPVLLFYVLIGVCMHVLTLHVSHDAAHGVLSKNKKVNTLGLMLMDIMGADSRIWQKRHIHGHHPYPNIVGKDADIGQSRVVTIFPGMPKNWIHRFQHIYMPFMYPFYTLYWFFIRDWQNLFGLAGGAIFSSKPSRERVVGFILMKVAALSWQIIIPCLLMPDRWLVFVAGFIVMHITASVLGALVLLSSHVDGESDFTQPDAEGNMPFTWAEHQVVSNADFSTTSRFWTAFFGGFNHHIAHHLFPYISKSRLAPLSPVIRAYCRKYNIPYRDLPFGAGLLGHIKFLKR